MIYYAPNQATRMDVEIIRSFQNVKGIKSLKSCSVLPFLSYKSLLCGRSNIFQTGDSWDSIKKGNITGRF